MAARLLLSDAQWELLAALDSGTKYAIKRAFVEWVETARAEGYKPIAVKSEYSLDTGWQNFWAEVDHSALLERILSGKKPLPERPETNHSYPIYPD